MGLRFGGSLPQVPLRLWLEKRYSIEKMCNKRLLLILVSLSSWAEAKNQMDGEFVAGSFILTQKSLSEAPHRYATVLREVLDKVANRKDWSYTKTD